MIVLFLAFTVAASVTFFVIRSSRAHGHLSADADMSGPQKFHATPVPRIGGVGIVVGLVAALLVAFMLRGYDMKAGLMLLATAAPAFLGGLAEDLTKTQSPRRRLFFTAVSALFAAWALDAVVRRTDIPGIDAMVAFAVPAWLITVFAVAGVANSINIIDGFNGLASMCVVMVLGGLAYVSFQAQDPVLGLCALAGLGAVLGFFVWNFPAGLIFLGDGGAYFLGFWVAELSVLLVARNDEVSPLCPLLMCIYPIVETVFSMYRRRVVRGRPMGMPDGVHLHSLVYRRLMRWAMGNRTAKVLTKRNSMTAPYLWLLCMTSVVPAMLFWNNSAVLAVFIVLFGALYVMLYARIVRFRAPDWLIVRH